jgi:hypothetical protein
MADGLIVFICYAHEDEAEKDRLLTQFAGLRRQKLIHTWHDRVIKPGSDWDDEIETALNSCELALLLVSSDFIASEYIQSTELTTLLERRGKGEVEVVPIIVKPCSWELEKTLAPLQALPKNGKPIVTFPEDNGEREQARTDITKWIAELAKSRLAVSEPAASETTPEPVQKPAVSKTTPISKPQDEVNDAAERVTNLLESGNVTFIIGRAAADSLDVGIPSSQEVSDKLLNTLAVIEEGQPSVSLPFDISANYYAVQESEANLENRVADMLTTRTGKIAPIYEELANVLSALSDRPQRRSRNRLPQLVITTNLDVLLEGALLSAGVPFTRIVQYRAAPRVAISEFSKVDRLEDGKIRVESPRGDTREFDPHDAVAMEEVIADHDLRVVESTSDPNSGGAINPVESLPIDKLTQPIIYKYLGSKDVSNSCTLSIDQSFEFMWWKLRRRSIPKAIVKIIGNSSLLFLGGGILEPDFRLCYHTLLREPAEMNTNEHFMICNTPVADENNWSQRNLELKLWMRVKSTALRLYKLSILEARNRDFLALLCDSLAEQVERRRKKDAV